MNKRKERINKQFKGSKLREKILIDKDTRAYDFILANVR